MTIWERPEPPSRPALSPLSRERIVRAAIELADRDGLAAVSLRKVGAALDAGPMRLYGYLSTKDELLDLMVDAVYAEITTPGLGAADWRATLRTLALRTRQAVHRHEWFAELVGGRPQVGPHGLAYLEAVLATLDGTPGLGDIDEVMQAAHVVNAYVIGATRSEISDLRAERATGLDERQWQLSLGPYLRQMLDTGRFPTLEKAMLEATHPGADQTFETGLDYVLDGIAARISTRRGAASTASSASAASPPVSSPTPPDGRTGSGPAG